MSRSPGFATIARPIGDRTVTDAAELGTVLGIWAHPDDEAFLSAGLMAAARDAGNRVVCVTATLGEHGTDDSRRWPPERLAAVREHELRASLAALGVTEHHQLGIVDGTCAAAAPRGDRAAPRPDHRPGRAGHDRHLRAGRDDRARGPPDGVGVGHRRPRRRGPRGAAALRDHDRGVRRRVGARSARTSTSSWPRGFRCAPRTPSWTCACAWTRPSSTARSSRCGLRPARRRGCSRRSARSGCGAGGPPRRSSRPTGPAAGVGNLAGGGMITTCDRGASPRLEAVRDATPVVLAYLPFGLDARRDPRRYPGVTVDRLVVLAAAVRWGGPAGCGAAARHRRERDRRGARRAGRERPHAALQRGAGPAHGRLAGTLAVGRCLLPGRSGLRAGRHPLRGAERNRSCS